MHWKRNLILIFCLLAGIILGALIASVCQNIPFLSWLAFSRSVGVSPQTPMVVDLSVVRISFGFEMGINVAQIFTIAGGILFYRVLIRKI